MKYPRSLEFYKVKKYIEDYCQSEAGRMLTGRLQPLSSKAAIEQRLRLTDEIQLLLKEKIHYNFLDLTDLKQLLYENNGQVYDFEEFRQIIRNQETAEEIIKDEKRYELFPQFYELASGLSSLHEIVVRFHKVYGVDGDILDNASAALYAIRRRQKQVRKSIMSVLQQKLKDYNAHSYLQDEVVTQREGRFVVPVKRSATGFVRGIVHGESGSGSSVYLEPAEVVSLNNDVHLLEDEERSEIYRIVRELTTAILAEKSSLQTNTEILAKIDHYYAVALWSNRTGASSPEIVDEAVVNLLKARHPLLIETLGSVDLVIPFDLELGREFGILLISGPNTGGKTVTLKTTGLLVLMAMSGLPIPAESDSQIGMFEAVYADIGDNQSLENSLSTFSSHIARLKEMLDCQEERVLVLIDEIGSATDPEQGSALAQVVLETLSRKGVLGVVTTHYTALKVFAERDERCQNAAMQFDPENHVPTYHFIPGLPGNSFAIEVASRLGMSGEIIDRARELAGKQNVELTDLIQKMSTEKKELSRQVYQYELKSSLLRQKIDEVQRKIDKLAAESKQIKKQSSREAKEYLSTLQKELTGEIDHIRKGDREQRKQHYEEELRKVVRMNNELDIENLEYELEGRRELRDVNIGQRVFLRDIDTEGIVVEISRNKIKVDLDGMYYTTKLKNLFSATAEEKVEEMNSSGVPQPSARFELKLLGYRYEEAMPEVEQLIDEAVMSGLNYVRIVHGKGTGALRQKIRGYLRTNKHVAEFFSPAPEAGGDGVTVCKLIAE
ncbi:MAG: endonuclease MutS2 [Candidatus Cloacimonetes bacterium]|nr:endonuclease MutS2 [Candidatus Cloacimonadota bacterium]